MNQKALFQFARFAGVGGLGLIVDVGITVLLIRHGLDPLLSRIVAISLAMATTWRLNRALTFGPSEFGQAREGIRYFGIATLVALVNYAIFAILVLSYPELFPGIAVVIAVAVSTGLSFQGYRTFAFKKSA